MFCSVVGCISVSTAHCETALDMGAAASLQNNPHAIEKCRLEFATLFAEEYAKYSLSDKFDRDYFIGTSLRIFRKKKLESELFKL
jgi:hypothetical protein